MGRQSTRDRWWAFGRFRLLDLALQGFTLIPTSGQGHKWSPRSWNWPTRSRNPPIPAHSQALTAFRSTTYTCKNWKGLVIRLNARHQLWRANLTWELVIQKGRKEGVVGEGRGAKTLRVIKKTIIQTWGGGEKYPHCIIEKLTRDARQLGIITL
jgi:hypothetical protein